MWGQAGLEWSTTETNDLSNPGCWSKLLDNSDSDAFQPEPEDPLLTRYHGTDRPLGMDASPLYPGCQFSVVESVADGTAFLSKVKLKLQTCHGYCM